MQDTDVHDFLRDFSGDEVVVNSDYIDKNISEVNKRVEYLGFNIKRRKYRLGGKTRIDFCIINAVSIVGRLCRIAILEHLSPSIYFS